MRIKIKILHAINVKRSDAQQIPYIKQLWYFILFKLNDLHICLLKEVTNVLLVKCTRQIDIFISPISV